jgi:hypothetical protein
MVEGSFGIVRIRVGKESQVYFLYELPADFGRGFKVEKMPADPADEEVSYQVNVDGDAKSCTCKGFCRWNKCKHSDGLAALIAAGVL